MPLVQIPHNEDAEWQALRNRILLVGPPNTGKTASLETFVGPEERIAYIQLPGEQGAGTFPAKKFGDRAVVFVDKTDDPTKVDWVREVSGLKQLSIDIITGKYGKIDVVALDGLHKGWDIFLAKATGGASAKTLDFDAKLYVDAGKEFVVSWLHMFFRAVTAGKIKRVVATIWDGREKDDPDDKSKTAASHLFPELPGKLAKGIVGEFGVVLGAGVQGVGGGAKFQWQTRPFGKVGGVGIKVPKDIAAKIETFIPQDWALLAPKLEGK